MGRSQSLIRRQTSITSYHEVLKDISATSLAVNHKFVARIWGLTTRCSVFGLLALCRHVDLVVNFKRYQAASHDRPIYGVYDKGCRLIGPFVKMARNKKHPVVSPSILPIDTNELKGNLLTWRGVV